MVIRDVLFSFFCFYLTRAAPSTKDSQIIIPPADRLMMKWEPQVAVKCGYINQYMMENGHWAANKDGDATCLTRSEEILKICRKAYPDLQITNVVESPRMQRIDSWCQDGTDQCSHAIWVKPYRCIVGTFQSDALLVPEGCNFSHTYDKRECKDYQFWNQTAQEACALKAEVTRSFGMLVPCGINLFSGVEYVCCPLEMDAAALTETRNIEAERSRTRLQAPTTARPRNVDGDEDEEEEDNWQTDYLRDDDEFNEHEKYESAMKKLAKHHQDRIDKMMKEWTEVSQRNKELKKTDPAGAKKLKSELMSRIRKTLAALNEEFEDEKRQLSDLHQQRIEVSLNNKKRESMDGYLDAIQERYPKTNKILKYLQRYIRAEEKDRQHTINRYRHLLNTDPDIAEDRESTTLAKLKDLDQRINESMRMLERIPDSVVAREVESKARAFWEQHRAELFGSNIDSDHLLIKYKNEGSAERTRSEVERQRDLESKFDQLEASAEDDEDEEDEVTDDDDLQQEPESEMTVTTPRTTTISTTEKEIIDKEGLSYLPPGEQFPVREVEMVSSITTTMTTTTTEPAEDEEDDTTDDSQDLTDDDNSDADDVADENELERQEKEIVTQKFQDMRGNVDAKLRRSEVPQYSAVSQILPDDHATGKVLYIAFGLAGVGLLAAMVLAIVLLRRRGHPSKEGFAPVDTYASPEERHVANMQAHGYTNPFFNHIHQYSKA